MALASDLVQIGFSSIESDFLGDSRNSAVACAGNTQGTATALTSNISLLSSATAGSAEGIRLPLITSIRRVWWFIHNPLVVDIKLYPATNDRINGLAENAALTVAAGASVILTAVSSTRWVSR